MQTQSNLVFPRTYAVQVIAHAIQKKKRGRNPSMSFLGERNPRKALMFAQSVLMPDNGVIKDRLLRLREYLPNQQKLVYSFAEYLAQHVNADLVPEGFFLAANLALYDLQEGVDGYSGKPIRNEAVGQVPLIYTLLELSIPQIAQAIFPSDFASCISKQAEELNRKMREERAQAKASAPAPSLPSDPLLVYTAMRQIADLSFKFYEVMGSGGDIMKPSCGDRRSEGVNPFYNQTTGGIFIEQYYGGPGSIWTPWGKWGCWGGGSGRGEKAMQDFLSAIGKVEVFKPVEHSQMGSVGPIYAVLQVGDVVLPKPELRERVSYLEYEEANRLWAEVEAMYTKEVVLQ